MRQGGSQLTKQALVPTPAPAMGPGERCTAIIPDEVMSLASRTLSRPLLPQPIGMNHQQQLVVPSSPSPVHRTESPTLEDQQTTYIRRFASYFIKSQPLSAELVARLRSLYTEDVCPPNSPEAVDRLFEQVCSAGGTAPLYHPEKIVGRVDIKYYLCYVLLHSYLFPNMATMLNRSSNNSSHNLYHAIFFGRRGCGRKHVLLHFARTLGVSLIVLNVPFIKGVSNLFATIMEYAYRTCPNGCPLIVYLDSTWDTLIRDSTEQVIKQEYRDHLLLQHKVNLQNFFLIHGADYTEQTCPFECSLISDVVYNIHNTRICVENHLSEEGIFKVLQQYVGMLWRKIVEGGKYDKSMIRPRPAQSRYYETLCGRLNEIVLFISRWEYSTVKEIHQYLDQVISIGMSQLSNAMYMRIYEEVPDTPQEACNHLVQCILHLLDPRQLNVVGAPTEYTFLQIVPAPGTG